MRGDDFAELYRRYLPRVLNYMRLRVDDEPLAQDLTAATFERAFAKRRQLRDPDAFAAWLFRIARNELGQHYRRRSRRGAHAPLEAAFSVPDSDPLPEEEAARRQELAELLVAVAELSEREQEIIGLRFVAGLTNRAIARVLRLSEGNVAVILYRAMRKLRDRLTEGA
ncbi:MAG: sigma-70 family RNA polymerase sigma factor [Chloroflexi bacterium]|nr:sigma-70 family RNA polymerase sigma factor [Chloroflexota bacterium]